MFFKVKKIKLVFGIVFFTFVILVFAITVNSAKKSCVYKCLEEGVSNPLNSGVKRLLQDMGFYKGKVDDNFDREMTNAVKSLQRKYGCQADGKVGACTAELIQNYYSKPAPGETSQERKANERLVYEEVTENLQGILNKDLNVPNTVANGPTQEDTFSADAPPDGGYPTGGPIERIDLPPPSNPNPSNVGGKVSGPQTSQGLVDDWGAAANNPEPSKSGSGVPFKIVNGPNAEGPPSIDYKPPGPRRNADSLIGGGTPLDPAPKRERNWIQKILGTNNPDSNGLNESTGASGVTTASLDPTNSGGNSLNTGSNLGNLTNPFLEGETSQGYSSINTPLANEFNKLTAAANLPAETSIFDYFRSRKLPTQNESPLQSTNNVANFTPDIDEDPFPSISSSAYLAAAQEAVDKANAEINSIPWWNLSGAVSSRIKLSDKFSELNALKAADKILANTNPEALKAQMASLMDPNGRTIREGQFLRYAGLDQKLREYNEAKNLIAKADEAARQREENARQDAAQDERIENLGNVGELARELNDAEQAYEKFKNLPNSREKESAYREMVDAQIAFDEAKRDLIRNAPAYSVLNQAPADKARAEAVAKVAAEKATNEMVNKFGEPTPAEQGGIVEKKEKVMVCENKAEGKCEKYDKILRCTGADNSKDCEVVYLKGENPDIKVGDSTVVKKGPQGEKPVPQDALLKGKKIVIEKEIPQKTTFDPFGTPVLKKTVNPQSLPEPDPTGNSDVGATEVYVP